MKPMHTYLSLSLALLATLFTSACAPVILAGAAGGSVFVVTDRRSVGTQVEDEAIEIKGNSRMKDQFGIDTHINVTSFNRKVLLTGQVQSEKDRLYAGQLAGKLDNVSSVINELELGFPTSVATRTKDALVSTKVRATLVDSHDLSANAFSVTTENGVVYLMGRVTEREAKSATDLIRTISGVRKVVRAFDIISEDELRRLMPPPPKEAPVKKLN